jgi:hypothetical protein
MINLKQSQLFQVIVINDINKTKWKVKEIVVLDESLIQMNEII